MSDATYRNYGIFDRSPSGVLRQIRKYTNNAQDALFEFRFADAKKELERAQVLADALQTELEAPSEAGEGG